MTLRDHARYGPSDQIRRVSNVDFASGRCMTCDSDVKWPKEIDVFRCTVCHTINDLKPIPAPRGFPLSVSRTRHIIDQCLQLYLQTTIQNVERKDGLGQPFRNLENYITDNFHSHLIHQSFIDASPSKYFLCSNEKFNCRTSC